MSSILIRRIALPHFTRVQVVVPSISAMAASSMVFKLERSKLAETSI
jgi:hypothetical protein